MSLQLPVGSESLNISFQAFGFPEGGCFTLASENSDNCIKYCRNLRMKEEIHQDKKEKAKRRHLSLLCSSFLASCWVIYPRFGHAERVQGKPEDGRGLNFLVFSEVLGKNSPAEGCWFTAQLDIPNTAPTLCSKWGPAGTGGGPDCHLGAAGFCHPPVHHQPPFQEIPTAAIPQPGGTSSSPTAGSALPGRPARSQAVPSLPSHLPLAGRQDFVS